MRDPEPFVDTHCHLLPGVDDGAADWDESLAMARLAVADGITTIVVTPHQLGSHRHLDGRTIRARTAHLQEVLRREGVPLDVLPGAEVRIEPDMIGRIRTGEVLTLADRGRYVLLEMPHEVCLPLDRLTANLDRAGLIGIVAHVERNQGILGRPRAAESLLNAGCLLQVTAGSIVGTFGPEVQKVAEWLIAQGMVHFVATDAHSAKSRRPLMRRSFHRVAELVGYRAACGMCCHNPAAVVADTTIPPGRTAAKPTLLGRWFGWSKAS